MKTENSAVRCFAGVCLGWLALCLAARCLAAPEIQPKLAELAGLWGDRGDGSYVNPVLPGDYSDIDAIRVGDDYFAMSSTFQYSPGVVILHSKDLVNWTILSHAVPDIGQIGPEMNWDSMNRYGRGIWAGAMRFHDGKFYVYFGTPDEGFFMTSAADAAGPWAPLTHVMDAKGWDDCCPFWDDDGQSYLVCTNFSDAYKIHLFKMSPDGTKILPGFDKVIHQSKGSEANKLYKINGLYYHFFSESGSEGRAAMMERSKSLDGPWEIKQLNHVAKKLDKEPNQGGLIELPSGEWQFLTHQGTGDWEGRAMALLPVTWIDGWPVIGKPGADGIGNMVWTAKKPVAGGAIAAPQTSDAFDADKLGAQWEWNYKPRDDHWSLAERPGWLRLHAFKPLKAGDLLKAGNTLTQRVYRTNANRVTVKLDLAGMADGQVAGLCHLAKSWIELGVVQDGASRKLFVNRNGKTEAGSAVESDSIWLRSEWGYDGSSRFSWSADGKTFQAIGEPYQLTWSYYRGDRLGIFSYNDKADAGFVDVDAFEYSFAKPDGAAPAVSN